MKCEWQFFFEVHGFRFARRHRFKGLIDEANRKALGLPGNADHFLVTIEPDAECKFPGAEQSGVLKILLPGDRDVTKRAAYMLASNAAETASFQHKGNFKVHGGLVTGKRIRARHRREQGSP